MHVAAQLAEAVRDTAIEPGVVVQADRGIKQLIATLGVDQSFGRSQVSDDNAFSVAQLNTLKY